MYKSKLNHVVTVVSHANIKLKYIPIAGSTGTKGALKFPSEGKLICLIRHNFSNAPIQIITEKIVNPHHILF